MIEQAAASTIGIRPHRARPTVSRRPAMLLSGTFMFVAETPSTMFSLFRVRLSTFSCAPVRIAPIFLLALAAASGAVAQEPTDSTRLDYVKIERLATQDRTESDKESGEDVPGREVWFNLRRSYPYGFIPAG